MNKAATKDDDHHLKYVETGYGRDTNGELATFSISTGTSGANNFFSNSAKQFTVGPSLFFTILLLVLTTGWVVFSIEKLVLKIAIITTNMITTIM